MNTSSLIILDPSLVSTQGHHYELAHLLSLAAQRASLDVKWLAHKDFPLDLTPAGVQVFPHFQSSMYDQYKKGAQTQAPAPIAEQIETGLKSCRATPDDHVLVHTGDGNIYRALNQILSQRDFRTLPKLHICTPYDIVTMPGKTKGETLEQTFADLRSQDCLNRTLFSWAETAPLARHMTRTLGIETLPLEIPPAKAISAKRMPQDGPVTFVYMGAAREEKGFHLLPELIRRVSEKLAPGKVFFDIQASPQIIGYLPIIKKAITQLETFPGDLVHLRRENQSPETYKSTLAHCHGVLLLYDQQKYRIRGSGIAVEAISNGKVLVTTQDTFPASLITHGGGIVANDVETWANGIVDMARNTSRFMARAAVQQIDYEVKNTSDRYISRLLERPSYARHLVSSPYCRIQNDFPMMVQSGLTDISAGKTS
ncbi:MAG: hypothetical protein COC12_00215 [Rhodobacteraceae bacterium]|nr:MAG: hypothetical protein COC12_00215 [Paracoccaceae bacterium]